MSFTEKENQRVLKDLNNGNKLTKIASLNLQVTPQIKPVQLNVPAYISHRTVALIPVANCTPPHVTSFSGDTSQVTVENLSRTLALQ